MFFIHNRNYEPPLPEFDPVSKASKQETDKLFKRLSMIPLEQLTAEDKEQITCCTAALHTNIDVFNDICKRIRSTQTIPNSALSETSQQQLPASGSVDAPSSVGAPTQHSVPSHSVMQPTLRSPSKRPVPAMASKVPTTGPSQLLPSRERQLSHHKQIPPDQNNLILSAVFPLLSNDSLDLLGDWLRRTQLERANAGVSGDHPDVLNESPLEAIGGATGSIAATITPRGFQESGRTSEVAVGATRKEKLAVESISLADSLGTSSLCECSDFA